MATTQVVNLLHFRSLNLGQTPTNLEFGQFAVNTYNGNNPTLPNLREVFLYVGTGGNDRVDEQGNDLSAAAAAAAAAFGEALVNQKGWVRFNLRSMKLSGDSMYGDLIMSGARIRFEPGTSGNAELILPDELTAANATLPGSIRYNTTSGKVEFWDGAWASLSPFDFQVATADPTTRSIGSVLADGDFYYNSILAKLYVYQTGVWSETQDNTDVQVNAAVPASRSNSGNLRVGDIHFNPTSDTLFVWDGAAWQKVIGSPGDYQSSATAPTVRSSGDPLISGDQWFDTATNRLKIWDGVSAWLDFATKSDFQITTTTTPTLRSDAVSALQLGDWWYDNSALAPFLSFWDGTQWVKTTDGGVY